MDQIVKQAMAKWPNVPAVFGWLGLDARGEWSIKGDRIANHVVTDFIGRNYLADAEGRWYFQNGPQRVFVTLALTPLVYRLGAGQRAQLQAHTGQSVAAIDRVWLDDAGRLLMATALGPGALDDRDLDDVLTRFADANGEPLADDALESAITRTQSGTADLLTLRWDAEVLPIYPLRSAEAPRVLRYVPAPQPPPGEEACV